MRQRQFRPPAGARPHRGIRTLLGVATAATVILACNTAPPASAADAPYSVLVFSKTAGFRHDSIPVGIQTIRDLGAANNFTVTATEDAAQFNATNLARFEAVVFLNTTGDVLDATQQTAFENYIRAGGGYVGVHSAADTEYDWPFYGELMGAYFNSHPAIQQVTERVENRAHAATAQLNPTWVRTDEWYNYRTNVRSSARVLATLDESTYSGGTMGADHPHTWCKAFQGGRAFYTGNGHTQPSSDPVNTAINQGYEVQIDATDAPDRTTGAVYTFKAADIAARDAALNPPGEWNTFEILVEGERLQVFLNGVKINDFTNTDPVRSLTSGFVGIQNHSADDDVSFRNIRIKQL